MPCEACGLNKSHIFARSAKTSYMKLSELKTGERAVIVKVNGHGSFRKRIIEMGFVKGNKVKVILNAPLRDPIEYEIIGYKISLRRAEADNIESSVRRRLRSFSRKGRLCRHWMPQGRHISRGR